jgi:alkylation response protein AidB-like acyl-CoA dehydrogenase
MIENKNRNQAEAASVAVAEDNRELDWKSKSFMASMFMGDFDVSMCFPFPEQEPEDKAIGDAFCAKVEAWASENIDGAQIDRDEEIPAHVLRGCAELGLMGIKIPKEYGGLGMSQTNYMRILSVIAHHCGSVAATLSAHQSIGVPQPLKLFGTEEQKRKYLPMFAKGALSAFALTEPTVGSDPANMMTVAEKDENGDWILNGTKLWCTNGVIADVIVVMARTPSIMKNGREIKQISAFIVETDQPGFEVLHRCRFMGIRAIENGVLRFKDMRIPKENLIWGEGKGLRLALTTLNDGRLSIPAITASGMEEVSVFMAQWAKTREQWGKLIGEHEAGADKLAFISSGAYAMKAFADYCAALSDMGDRDLRMEAAAAKLYNTELSWELSDVALQFRAGRGFETNESLEARGEVGFPMQRALRDTRINRIVEGTSDIMHLFLAREALDGHLRIAGGLFKKGATLGDKVGVLAKAGLFYARWYPKLYLGGLFKSYGQFDPRLRTWVKWVEKRSRRLARSLFHQMALRGPKLEMRQLILGRIVDIGAELAVMALVASRVQSEILRGDRSNLTKAVYWLHRRSHHVDDLFAAIWRNSDVLATELAKAEMDATTVLPAPPQVELTPQVRERSLDITSGRQPKRLWEGGTLPAPEKPAKTA